MRVLFVINPKSGPQIENRLDHLIAEQAERLNLEFQIHWMKETDEKIKITEFIQSFRPQIVAAAGGDGTVNLLAQIILNTDCALLIIPTGSANGMAKELGIGRIETAIGLLSKGVTRKIDLLRINGRICIHLADIGLNARIVKRFEGDRKRGIWTYARHLWSELFLIKQYRFYIRFNKTEVSKKAVSLTFANASKYGTGAVINPVGKIDDGRFELVIVKPFPRIKILSIAWKMFIGNLKNSEYVEVLSCTDAYIRSSKKTTLQIDGEVIGKTREIQVEILKQAIKMLVPPEM